MWLEPPTPPKGVPRRTAAGPRHHFSARAVAAKADDLPKIAEKADDLEAIKKAVEDAAAVSGALWFSYLFVLFYFAIAAGAVTHQDLFFEHPVKLPFLGIELPLVAFFFLAPILFLVVHAYTLVHLVMLADKAKRYHQALYEQMGDKDGLSDSEREDRKAKRDSLRRQLPSNIFVELLAGPSDLRESTFGWLLRAIAWLTLVIAPVLLLLLFQVQFLPFHNGFITWTHRVALAADLVLLAWLWRKVLPDRELGGPFSSWVWEALGLTVGLAVILLSWATITFPGEWQEGHLPEWRILPALAEWGQPKKETLREWVFNSTKLSPHDWLFAEEPNPVTRRRLPFSSTLVLPSLNVYEGLGMDDPEKAKWHDYVFRARGRDLKGAIFDLANLPKVDFEGAELQGARLFRAQLQGASLHDAKLQGASLDYAGPQGADLRGARLENAMLRFAELQGAKLDGAHLEGAKFEDAKLQGASLELAQLQGASLDHARLQDAKLDGAQFQNARLDDAQLQHASLDYAGLQGASLIETQLQGASLYRAQLQGAALAGAKLQGARLDEARLEGASLVYAQLEGASLDVAQLQGATLYHAQLQGASLVHAQLQGASLEGAQLQGASLQDALLEATDLSKAFLWRTNRVEWSSSVAAVRLSDAPETWQPLWEPEVFEVQPWNDKVYQDLRQTMESIPPGGFRDQALARIRRLDCANPDTALASCDPSLPPSAEAAGWRLSLEKARVDDSAYAKALAPALRTLVCSGGDDATYVLRRIDSKAVYILHGVDARSFPTSRLGAAGQEAPALVDFIMSKDCPVSGALTDADKASLLRIKQDAIKKAGG